MRVRFAATSFTPEIASAYNEVMDKVSRPVHAAIADLRSAAKGYSWTKLVLFGPLLGTALQTPEDTRKAILSGLLLLENRLNQLEAKRSEVLNGTLSLDRWVSAVSYVADGVKTKAKDFKESTILSSLVTHYNESVRDAELAIAKFKATASELGESYKTGLKVGLPLIGVGLILAVIYLVPRLLGPTVIVRGMDGPTLNPKRLRGKRLY